MKEEFNAMIDILIELMEREDLATALAKFYGNLDKALIAEGFSAEASLEILKVMTVPGATKS